MCTYASALSGITFDEHNDPQAMILSRLSGDQLNIDLVGSMPGSDPKYVMAAFSNLIAYLEGNVDINGVSSVVGIPSDPHVKNFIADCENLGIASQKVCGTYYAKKNLSPVAADDISQPQDALTEGMEILWHREVNQVQNQPNIGWKVCWMNR